MFLNLEHTISGSKRKISKQKRNEISYNALHIGGKVKFIDVIDHFIKIKVLLMIKVNMYHSFETRDPLN